MGATIYALEPAAAVAGHVLRLVRAAYVRADRAAHAELRKLHAERPQEIDALALADGRLALLLADFRGRG